MTANALRDPVGTVQQAVAALPVPKGLVLGWAVAMLLPIVLYFVDLGAGSLSLLDAEVALVVRKVLAGQLLWNEAFRSVPPPTGGPIGIVPFVLLEPRVRDERSDPVARPGAGGTWRCELFVGDCDRRRNRTKHRRTGRSCALAMPLTYELSHRVLPDMLVAVASSGRSRWSATVCMATSLTVTSCRCKKPPRNPSPAAAPPADAVCGAGELVFRACSTCGQVCGTAVWFFRLRDLASLPAAQTTGLADVARWHTASARCVGDSWRRAANAVSSSGPGILCRRSTRCGDKAPAFMAVVGQVVVVTTCFGLLLGSMRRASRPLLVWVMLATLLTWVGGDLAPPRGLGLVLPPLALAAAVGLQSPVRWLGSLGGIITTLALAGVVLAVVEGDPVLHQSDTIKTLVQSLRHAPPTARRCVVGMSNTVPSYYSRRQIEQFESVHALKQSIGEKELFSCLVLSDMLPEMKTLLLKQPTAQPAAIKPRSKS